MQKFISNGIFRVDYLKMYTTLVELSNNNSQLLELKIPADRISLALDTLKFDRFKAWSLISHSVII